MKVVTYMLHLANVNVRIRGTAIVEIRPTRSRVKINICHDESLSNQN